MKKSAIFPILFLLVLLSKGALFAQEKPQESYKEIGSPLPPFLIVDRDGKSHAEAEFNKDGTLFLFMFNPTCEHCINMAKMLGAHEEEFGNSNIYFVAVPDMREQLDFFYEQTGADTFKHITIGIDSIDVVRKLYNFVLLPQLNIYSKDDRKLIEVLSGDIELDTLKSYIGR